MTTHRTHEAEEAYKKRLGNLRRKGLNTCAPTKNGGIAPNVQKDMDRRASRNYVGSGHSKNPNPRKPKPSNWTTATLFPCARVTREQGRSSHP